VTLAGTRLTAGTADRAAESPPLVVAIDPGHGGTNLGAAGPGRGVYEKHVTLALAQRVRDLLLLKDGSGAAPAVTVVLCRQTDSLVPIRARARCARDSGALLFLSLHANAVPAGVPHGAQHGFEVFVLGPREVEDDASLSQLSEGDDADAVWAAHEVRAAAEQSIVLGRIVDDHLTRALGVGARRGLKQAGAALDVLRGSNTAAALVEVGFLDDPTEGAKLASPSGREPIARALAGAIRGYLLTAGPAAQNEQIGQVPTNP
jgi:N-acetylmuramoyl-L-alanine amidase